MITNLDSESDEHFCLVLLPAMAISTAVSYTHLTLPTIA